MLIAVSALAQEPAIAPEAEGCVTSVARGCGITERGQLAAGDCTFTDGRRYDRYSLFLTGGKAVAISLRPLDSTFTNPDLVIQKPAFQNSSPPEVQHGAAATVWIKPIVSGTWTVTVTTNDVPAGGRYALHVDCYPEVSAGADCVEQELLCGNQGFGSLTTQSCRFGDTQRPYTEWLIYGVRGDRLKIIMTSVAFQPLFAIYRDGELLRTSSTDPLFGADMDFRVPETGWYSVLATATENNGFGDYAIQLNCERSGCLFPYIVDPVPSIITAPLGQPATIALNVHTIFPFMTSLFGSDIAPVTTSETPTIVTPPVTATPQQFFVKVENECGDDISNSFLLIVEPTKRRATRH